MESDDLDLIETWNTIIDHASTAENFVKGLSFAQFEADMRTNYATVYCLELIADATIELRDEARSQHPEVPWNDLIAAAEFYRVNYDRVSLDKVWRSLHEKLPILVAAAEAELRRLPDR